MKKFRLTNKNNQQATIEAASYTQDGSGTRFYDEDGNQITSFYDGEIRRVEPETLNWE